MLRAATQAAEQASQRSEIYLSFPARDENLVAKVRAFQEFFPGVVHVEKEVSEYVHICLKTPKYTLNPKTLVVGKTKKKRVSFLAMKYLPIAFHY